MTSLFIAALLGQNAAWSKAIDSISAESLRKNLTYIASDALEGRGTPSKGLDLAADYIAAQFKSAGIQPAVKGSYFQITDFSRQDKVVGQVRNVIGILPGSDPALKDTFVLVTAHYDHLGMRTVDGKSVIYNGANDDGSGTVSVIEIAKALGSLKVKPKRSIVFMTFWGEELGLRGSRYYGKNPVFPIAKTVADINIEQVGRTDDTEGPRVGAVSVTGADYSDLVDVMREAGKSTGIEVQRHPRYSDPYFGASDNQALADQGVPAHTICTAFEYPDYHRPSDHVEKIDFSNMVKVDKMVALTVLMTADNSKEPAWKEDVPRAKRYLEAWKKLHAKS